MEERRRVDREQVDDVAYILGDESSTRCRVINVSEDGAAIELPDARFIRSPFKLMIEKDRLVRDCRLVWSSGNRMGVAFTSATALLRGRALGQVNNRTHPAMSGQP